MPSSLAGTRGERSRSARRRNPYCALRIAACPYRRCRGVVSGALGSRPEACTVVLAENALINYLSLAHLGGGHYGDEEVGRVLTSS